VKKIYVILITLVLAAVTVMTTAAPVSACHDKDKIHFAIGAGTYNFHISLPGWEGNDGGLFGACLKEPDKGFFWLKCTYGGGSGSYEKIDAKQVSIGTLDGKPAVFFWGIITAGESYYEPQPGTPPLYEPPYYLQPYVNTNGYYKVGVLVDGGFPGRGKDYFLTSLSIPPDGWGAPGEAIAQYWYDGALAGDPSTLVTFARIDVTRGDIIVR